MPSLTTFIRWFDALMSAFCSAFAIAFGVCTLMVCADIVLRQLGVASMPWLVEVIEYVMYSGTFLAAPWVLRQGEHVRVDLVLSSVPHWIAIRLEQVVDALGALVSLVMCIYGTELLIDAYRADFIEFRKSCRARMGVAPANPDRLRDAGCRIHTPIFPRAGRRREDCDCARSTWNGQLTSWSGISHSS